MKIIQPGKEEFFIVPCNSTADTLQRIIFFKSAIASNSDSIILFEEPEAHSFPPFMTHITQEMIYKKDNQFFMATHSPFILNDLIENAREELAVFIVHYENYETKLTQLSAEEFKYEVDYLKEFAEVCKSGSLILHKHKSRHHYIIQIYPAVERFIMKNAEAVGISLEEFGLPSNFELLKKESKTVNSKKDQRFKKLFKSLNHHGAPEIIKLSAWISYLKEKNYKADMAVLKQL
ncbi:MAG: hypothetical protein ABIR50_05760 [Ginsengibacter sp.]